LRHQIILALVLSAVSGMAMAQDNSGSSNAVPPTAPASATATPQNGIPTTNVAPTTSVAAPNGNTEGLKTAHNASVAVRFVTVTPANVMSSNLIGTDVYNNQNEALGSIEDLVIDTATRSRGSS
jgi:PRC-barrel domain